MNKELLKEKSKAYFDNTTCEDIIKKFEVIGYTFVPMTTLASAEEAAKEAIPELKHIINSVSEARNLWIAAYNIATAHDAAEVKELREGLQQIADWDSHDRKLAVDQGSNGVRDFYRNIAIKLLNKTK